MAEAEPKGMTITSDEELAEAERAAAEYRAKQQAEAAAAREERLAPLRAVVNVKAFDKLVADLADIARSGALADDTLIDIHLRAAVQVLPNLKASLA